MTEKQTTKTEGQQLTAVLRNGGFSGKLKCSFSNQHLWWVDSEVLRNPPLRKAAKRQAVKKPLFSFMLSNSTIFKTDFLCLFAF
jgi:hypothetical protein